MGLSRWNPLSGLFAPCRRSAKWRIRASEFLLIPVGALSTAAYLKAPCVGPESFAAASGPEVALVVSVGLSYSIVQRGHKREGEAMRANPEAIPEGSHVQLMAHGQHLGSGVIDTWMPDGSAFWIWLDRGAGRRLVHETDDVHVLVSATDPQSASHDD